ncbi:hypothetical protein E4H12_15340 [Candidatus Thorarchaeota archaeon]|nr:hypothetical protein [Candidatus Thorarchaeota archaeon]TFG94343.1 MAG: hypothetical protein E4H12_15340 [Candidatus Thorarchaeota archaeon]
MKRNSRRKLLALFAALFILGMVIPVNAWSDVGMEYCDGAPTAAYGEWSWNDNTALEEYVGLWAYYLDLTFSYSGVDQDADVYKIRVNYDAGDGELIQLFYRWGTSSWTYCRLFGSSAEDFYYTITDASSTTLEVRFIDNTRSFDFHRDQWEFGGGPELWMYWY